MRETRILLGAMAVVLAAELTLLFRMSLAEIVHHVPDDSFFYLIFAERLRDFGRFSFDGEHLSYGFQPLYLGVIAALAWVFRDPLGLLYSALVLGSLLHLACAWQLFGLARSLFGRLAGWTAAAFWLANPALVSWFWSVKENGLYALLILCALRALLRTMDSEAPSRHARSLGLALGCTVLARTNSVLLCAAVAPLALLGVGWRAGTGPRFLSLARAAAWMSLVSVPWFVFARRTFGSAFPTSGTVKVSAGKEYVARELGVEWLSPAHVGHAARRTLDYLVDTLTLGMSGYGPLVQGVALAVLAAWLAGRWRGRVAAPFAGAAAATLTASLALCAALNAFLNALLLPQYLDYGQWYTVPEYVALGLAIGALGRLARDHLASARGLALLVPCLALGVLSQSQMRRIPWEWYGPKRDLLERRPLATTILLELGLWTREHVEEGERIGIRDPGILTFFSRRRLVPIDPLVNTRAFFLEERHRLPDYVRQNRLSYLFGPGVERDGRFLFPLLPEGSYEVVWVPYPEVDLGWNPTPCTWMLVRPLDTPGPAFLGPDDFDFGLHAPESGATDARAPARLRRVETALTGFRVECDVLRLRLGAGASGARLWLDAELARDTPPGPGGWIDWNLSRDRDREARVELAGGGTLLDAHCVDLRR